MLSWRRMALTIPFAICFLWPTTSNSQPADVGKRTEIVIKARIKEGQGS